MIGCACMGPMYNEPHCYCQMVKLGLPLSKQREEENARLKEALKDIFKEDYGQSETDGT